MKKPKMVLARELKPGEKFRHRGVTYCTQSVNVQMFDEKNGRVHLKLTLDGHPTQLVGLMLDMAFARV